MSEDAIPQPDQANGAPHPRETSVLLGQPHAEKAFLSAYNSERMHHAWLISGPRGVGKATLAWKIARFLLAQPASDDGGMFGDAVGPVSSLDTDPNHPISRRVNALGEPRLFLCRRPWDEKTKRLKKDITIDAVRQLKSFFTLSAADGGWRVAIVDAADELSNSSANALLKILEEPPAKTVLLLVAHQPARLLPTIRSRCRALACKPLPSDLLQQALLNAGATVSGYDSQTQEALGQLSAGSVGEAMRIVQGDGMDLYQGLLDLLATTPGLDRSKAINLADKCNARTGAETYDMVIYLITLMLARLARYGALQPSQWREATQNESQVFARLASNAVAARKWATLSQELSARVTHARAVNLDPSSVILDMLLKLDETARD